MSIIIFLLLFFLLHENQNIINGKEHILIYQNKLAQLKSTTKEDDEDDEQADVSTNVGGGGGGGLLGGGNPREMENEENMRLDFWPLFRNLDEFMISQNQKLMDALYGDAMIQNEEMEEVIYDLDHNLDNYTYKIFSKFTKMNSALEESRFGAAKTAVIAIEGQIRSATEQLKIYQGQLYRIQDQIPDEEEECGGFYTCKECLMNNGCGWCPTVNKCVVGDQNGPLFQQCAYYSYEFCQGKKCFKYDACNTCLSDSECGWCQVDEENIKVCLQQPRNFDGCPEGHWFHIAGDQFSCPFRKQQEVLEQEEVSSYKFWKRPKEQPKKCISIDEKMKAKLKKERAEYNDKSEYKDERDKNNEVQLNYKQNIQQKIASLKDLIEELQERKEQYLAFIDQYKQDHELEDEQQQQADEQENNNGEDNQDEGQNDGANNSNSQGENSNKVQVKKTKKKKIVQIIPEEYPIPEEQELQQEEQQEENVIIEYVEEEDDDELVFETSKEFQVVIGDIKQKQSLKKNLKKNNEDEKYKDQGDREIEGQIDVDYYNQYQQENRKRHWQDFDKYYQK